MANAAQLKLENPARVLIVGYPGSAKTGAIASLLNVGYKVRVIDFDGNYEPLLQYTDPKMLKNLDIATFEDRLKAGARFAEVIGEPSAFVNAWKMLDHWRYKNPDGSETDLGASKDWGLDTVLVLDNLSSMGQASMRRAMALKGKTPENTTDSTWGFAMAEQEALIDTLTSRRNRFHIVVLAHLKMIGPRDVRKGDDDLTKTLKKELAQLVPTRLFPSALGWQLPQTIAQYFPVTLEAAVQSLPGGKMKRVLRAIPREELDLKLPIPSLEKGEWPVSTGLASIFELLGHKPPTQGGNEAPKPGADAPQPEPVAPKE